MPTLPALKIFLDGILEALRTPLNYSEKAEPDVYISVRKFLLYRGAPTFWGLYTSTFSKNVEVAQEAVLPVTPFEPVLKSTEYVDHALEISRSPLLPKLSP